MNSLNNNNIDTTHDKNGSVVGGEILTVSNGNGDGSANATTVPDNFANFDAFSSSKEFDLFANDAEFGGGGGGGGGIGLNSTEIDGVNLITKSGIGKESNAAKDRFLGSLSNTLTKPPQTTKQSGAKHSYKGVSITDYFDAKFDSFVTNDVLNSAADESNANTKSTTQHAFGLDDTDGFADFSKANVFKATTTTNNNNNSRFETAFQSSNTIFHSAGKSKSPIHCDTQKNDDADKIASSKFRNDYSKNDQFDADLHEALKRSLVDQ